MDGRGVLLGAMPFFVPGDPAMGETDRPLTWDFLELPRVPGRVELRGIEPLTSSMPWKRSTN